MILELNVKDMTQLQFNYKIQYEYYLGRYDLLLECHIFNNKEHMLAL